MPRKIDFIIAGAQKAGTTSLWGYLRNHPDIHMASCKEVHLFDSPDYDNNYDFASKSFNQCYLKYFSAYEEHQLLGEATPIYMYLPEMPCRIYSYNPAMKIIFVLREPGERAISQYLHEKRLRREWLPLWLALYCEPLRLNRDMHNRNENSSLRAHSYVSRGRYFHQIKRFNKYFRPEQLLLLRSETLLRQPDVVMAAVCDFLEIPGFSIETPLKLNSAKRSHTGKYTSAKRWVARKCLLQTQALADLTGWDLSEWLEAAK